ncbi:amino acid ABC transporter permease [Bradyrhizobium uaiense]|uniref:Glutamate/aspartate import permease protein GltK n=1 Tax=Bradyrhizobium uaiense TaxID=2594946 RepID=A0A6P1BU83_9BRAD|nr:amino acid ABC transporter permease [Bradyrhizobium uaiense]NEV02098.1 amino acid ABC transporter permease [Bradyrhizobium uaiense]
MLQPVEKESAAVTNAELEQYDLSKFEHVPRKKLGRYVAAALIVAALLWLAIAFARGQIEWIYTAKYLFAPVILQGLLNTIALSVLAMLFGVTLGVSVAIMRFSSNPIINWSAMGYIWLFRGLPTLLQLLLWYNLALVFPTIWIPGVAEWRTVDVMTPFVAALLGLGINQGAYTSEVVRAGLLSVDHGQYEAASAIGMTRLRALRRIILPQAMRFIIPPIGNEFIGMVKWTSLASVIQYSELVYAAENIYYVNNRVIELLFVAAFWYLVIVSVLTVAQGRIERYYARGSSRGFQAAARR